MQEPVSPEIRTTNRKLALHLGEVVMGAGLMIEAAAVAGPNLLKIPLGVAGLVILGRGFTDSDRDLRRLSQLERQDNMSSPDNSI